MKRKNVWEFILFWTIVFAAVLAGISVEIFRAYTVYFLGLITLLMLRKGDKK